MTQHLVTVVGNPRPASRTMQAAASVIRHVCGSEPDDQIDLVGFGPELLNPTGSVMRRLRERVTAADLLVVASPTYKGSVCGVLKLFVDGWSRDELGGIPTVPLMLGGSADHSLAAELTLKPILVEIGATCPTRALYLIDREYDAPDALDGWLPLARKQLSRYVSATLPNPA